MKKLESFHICLAMKQNDRKKYNYTHIQFIHARAHMYTHVLNFFSVEFMQTSLKENGYQ